LIVSSGNVMFCLFVFNEDVMHACAMNG
jgi:hypothetical protein